MSKQIKQVYFSMAEVAKMLGVSKSLIEKRIYVDKTLKTVKVMGVTKIHKSELIRHGVRFGD